MEDKVQEPVVAYGNLFTYADYLKLEIEERIEIIKGKIFKMSPGPARLHQEVSRDLQYIFLKYFENRPCKVYDAPFDVRLLDSVKQSKKHEDIFTVVQPDLCVVCDFEKLDKLGCIGAPDLIVEILSPSNSKKEMLNKFRVYEENGVKEYWIIDYNREVIHIYVLKDGVYQGLKPYTNDEQVSSVLFPDLTFSVEEIFRNL